MTDDIDFIGMMEGLEPSQVRELTERIRNAVQREHSNFTKGVPMNDMTDMQFIETLSPDEKVAFLEDLTATRARIEGTRQAAKNAGLHGQYWQEITGIMQTYGNNHEGRIRAIADLKAKYRGLGLEVW